MSHSIPQPLPDFAGAEKFILKKLEDELSPDLCYHGLHHTLDVMKAAMEIADYEQISDADRKLLRVAVAFHDCGFIHTHHEHEQKSCELAKEILPDFCFDQLQLKIICNMILSTKIPQSPQTLLEQIICDADLDYLGREDVEPIAKSLFRELKMRGEISNEQEWNVLEINFLQSHNYHTSYSKLYRQQNQQAYLNKLLAD